MQNAVADQDHHYLPLVHLFLDTEWVVNRLVQILQHKRQRVNPCPAEPAYALPLQTVKIKISWLLKKPTDLDLHCLPFSI